MSAIDLYARPGPDFPARLAHSLTLLREAAAQWTPLAQASSLGAEDMVVTQLLHEAGLKLPVFVLDTGRLHAQTLELIGRAERHWGLKIEVHRPDPQAVAEYERANDAQAIYGSIEARKACCHLRKMVPLEQALAGRRGWITGLRREQSGTRAEVPEVDTSSARAKINPLAAWSWGDVWHYIALRGVPYNPLHDAFFPSIGCEPCTRAIAVGEDFRSGRWWWEQSAERECGLHAPGASALPARVIPIQELTA